MGDILSQNEIDDLLKALSSGEINAHEIQTTTQERKIKTHDFRRASKFAKDHIKTLNIIYDNYARLVTNFLTGYLRTLVQVDVVSVEALPYSDFSNSVANPVIMAVVDFAPLSGSIIFEIEPHIAYALVDRILGGKGSTMERVREFTEIELAIIERITIQMLNLMREPWENVLSIRPRLDKIETNAQFAQIVAQNETVALITLSARIGEADGMMNICIPHMVVEPIVSKLSTRFWFSNVEKEATPEMKRDIEKGVQSTAVPVKAVLGRTKITVGDFLELQSGDVLALDSGVNEELEVRVGDLLKFYAIPGVRKNKVAVKITRVVKKEEE
ncbi:MAG: flagellar motor switch protein FliM [Clostridiaceae bacterium]|jgi:flagellar motor switch protein FliM|nr:flagellar motor switch protein FliM [Bacillota bacterium]NLP08460.1 flagellar motor switch protein FliM [Clostridiaceae bacterium]